MPLKQRFYACVNGSVHSYLPPCLLFRLNTCRAGFTYLQFSLNDFNGHLFLQKRIFFILLCFAVMSLIFLYQNPQWSLESIRILRHKYDLSTSDNGELNNCFISKQPTFCDRTAFPGKCISTTKKVLAVLCSVDKARKEVTRPRKKVWVKPRGYEGREQILSFCDIFVNLILRQGHPAWLLKEQSLTG